MESRKYSTILKNLLRRFPNQKMMGKLTLRIFHIKTLSPQYALAIGRYQLFRGQKEGGIVSGYFTTLFQRTPAGWKIAVDHTS